jgi:peptide subunit release factor 1 (eRF1)
LQEKLVGLVPGSGRTSLSEIVKTTLATFIEAEEWESRSSVEDLVGQIRTGGLAVGGTEACLLALQRGQVDMLILAKDSGSESGYTCTSPWPAR